MNIQEYISSGIVESYVLGLASPEEQREFEKNCEEYPGILEARIAFELELEQQAMQNAIAAPAGLQQQITAAVTAGNATGIPAGSASLVKMNWLKYAVAAVLLLLAVSLYWNVSLYRQYEKATADRALLQTRYDTTAARMNEMESSLAVLMDNPNVKMAAMKGLEPAPTAFATVYWDSLSRDVYLTINNLPAPASDKQYQLWALLNGQPIDLGLIPNDYFISRKKLLLTMKNTASAQAFAITLEKKGGSTEGPQGKMYTLGNL